MTVHGAVLRARDPSHVCDWQGGVCKGEMYEDSCRIGGFKRPVPVYAPELCPVESLSLAGMFAQLIESAEEIQEESPK